MSSSTNNNEYGSFGSAAIEVNALNLNLFNRPHCFLLFTIALQVGGVFLPAGTELVRHRRFHGQLPSACLGRSCNAFSHVSSRDIHQSFSFPIVSYVGFVSGGVLPPSMSYRNRLLPERKEGEMEDTWDNANIKDESRPVKRAQSPTFEYC